MTKTTKFMFSFIFFSPFVLIHLLSADIVAAFTPSVVINSNGYGVAVWEGNENNTDYVIRASTLTPGGTWSGATTISGTLTENQVPIDSPYVVINNNNNAAIIWSAFDEVNSIYQTATRRVSMTGTITWDTGPNIISTSTEDPAYEDQKIAMDDSDNITAVWTSFFNSVTTARGATATMSQSTWDSSSTFSFDP